MDAGFFGIVRGAAEFARPGGGLKVRNGAANIALDVATLRQHCGQLLPAALHAGLRAGR